MDKGSKAPVKLIHSDHSFNPIEKTSKLLKLRVKNGWGFLIWGDCYIFRSKEDSLITFVCLNVNVKVGIYFFEKREGNMITFSL